MTSSSKSTEILPPKVALLERKVRLTQQLFKVQFKRNLCYYKTNDFLVDHFEPSPDDLKSFIQSINGKALKHQVALNWAERLQALHNQVQEEMAEIDDSESQLGRPDEPQIEFSPSTPEMEKVVQRALSLFAEFGVELDPLSLIMDLSGAKNFIPEISFEALLGFKDGDFAHDISGIIRNLNRTTGRLENHFLPRCVRYAKTVN